MRRELTLGALLAVTCLTATSRTAPAQVTTGFVKLTAPDGQAGDGFGCSVDLDGGRLVVGTYRDDVSGRPDAGSAYVFERDGEEWSPEPVKLVAADPVPAAELGFAISLSGAAFVVGAPARIAPGAAGTAYVFRRAGAAWGQEARLTADDAEPADRFGHAVAIDGDTLVVGAPGSSALGTLSGKAYVFRRSGGVWVQQAGLTASDGQPFDGFGHSIAIDGDTVAVGAPFDDDAGSAAGSAYVFARAGTTWSQVAKLTAADGRAEDQLGWSVAAAGSAAVAGARGADASGVDAGAVYVFRRAGSWSQEAKLLAGMAGAGDRFGTAVAISGNRLLASAPLADARGVDSGVAYVFARSGGTWGSQDVFLPEALGAGDQLGISVAVDGDDVALGTYLDDEQAGDAGAVYVLGDGGGGGGGGGGEDDIADLAITKDDGLSTVTPGGVVTYTIEVTNLGPSAVTGARVRDTFPPELTGVSWSRTPPAACAPACTGPIDDVLPALSPGARVTYVASGIVACDASGELVNTAEVSAPAGVMDPAAGNNVASDRDEIVPLPVDLAITKTVDAPDPLCPGDGLSYRVAVSHGGPCPLAAVVSDAFPPELTGVSWSRTPTAGCEPCAGDVLDGVDLAPGEEVVYDVVATVTAGAAGTVVNEACVEALGGPGAAVCATAEAQVNPPADLRVEKAGPSSVASGEEVTYTLTVTNDGPGVAKDVVLHDPTPEGFLVVAAGGACEEFPCQLGQLSPGEVVGATVTFEAPAQLCLPAEVVNRAEVTAASIDPDLSNNLAEVATTVEPGPGLCALKTIVGGFFVEGGMVTYSVLLENHSALAQGDNPGDEFVDVLPPELTLTSAAATSGTAATAGNTVTWNGAIPAFGSVTLTIMATIDPMTVGLEVCNQGFFLWDADGNGVNETVVLTDDPDLPGVTDPTCFHVLFPTPPGIPALSPPGLALLLVALAAAAVARLRRRARADPHGGRG